MEDSILVWEGEGGSLSEALSQTGSVDRLNGQNAW
jgi:hypothetical protein